MKESDLQGAVIECAKLFGWRVAHFRPAQTKSGWVTPVAADGKGFPDLCMVNAKQRRLIFAELKRAGGSLSEDQKMWVHDLAPVCEMYVWFPDDWLSGEIEMCLRGSRGKPTLI